MEKVSIIIPVYNAAGSLPKCIESCINQTYRNIEIIIVIDGSPDNCHEIAKFYQEKDNRLVIIFQENQGLPRARRIGYEKSTGEFIFHLDNDDYLEPETIEILLFKAIQEDADICIGGTIYEDKLGNFITNWINRFSSRNKVECLKAIFSSVIQPSIWGRLIRREMFEPVYVPNHFTLGEDFLANVMMICYASKIKIVCESKLLYHYVVYKESLTNSKKGEEWVTYTDKISEILLANNIEDMVIEEWAHFCVIKSWRYYLRSGGKKYLKDKKYVNKFYQKYFSVVKHRLTNIEQLELNLYRYNQFIAFNFSRLYVKWLKITRQSVN